MVVLFERGHWDRGQVFMFYWWQIASSKRISSMLELGEKLLVLYALLWGTALSRTLNRSDAQKWKNLPESVLCSGIISTFCCLEHLRNSNCSRAIAYNFRCSPNGHLRYKIAMPGTNGPNFNFTTIKNSYVTLLRKMSPDALHVEDFCASVQVLLLTCTSSYK